LISGALVGKPAGVFTRPKHFMAAGSTLLSMIALLHHGMYLWACHTQRRPDDTRSGGTPYGASHVAALTQHGELSEQESAWARMGTRVAALAAQLATRA